MDVRLRRWWKAVHVRGRVEIRKLTETHTCTVLEKTSNENDFTLSLHLELAAVSSLWKNIEVNSGIRMKVADHVWCKCKVDHVDKLDSTKPNRMLGVIIRWKKAAYGEKAAAKVACGGSNVAPTMQNEKEVYDKGSKKRDTEHENEESSKKPKVDPVDSEIPDLKTEDGHEAGVKMEENQVKSEEHIGKSKGKKTRKGYTPNERMTDKAAAKVACGGSNVAPTLQNEKEVQDKGSKKRDTEHEESSKKPKVDPIDSEIPDLKSEDGHEVGVKMEEVQVKSEEHTGKSKGKKTRKGYTPNERMTEFLIRHKKDTQANPKKKSKRLTLKDVKEAQGTNGTSKEDAILSIMMVHYMAGTKAVTFERIFTDLGYRPKNRAMEMAWKSVREDNLVEADKTTKKAYRLTDTGLDRAAPPGYKEELAKALPQTTAELHECIKETAVNPYGILIFEILHEAKDKGEGMTRRELADVCGVNKDSHGFFYGFKWLKDNEYAIPDSGTKRQQKYSLNDKKCFLDDYSPNKLSSKE